MKTTQLLGGFEIKLAEKLVYDGDKVFFKSIELNIERTSRRATTNFDDIRNSILDGLTKFLTERFEVEEVILQKMIPFVQFSSNADIEGIHSLLAPDISLPSLYMQFNDFSNTDEMKDMSVGEIILKLSKTEESRNTYKELIIVLARIEACTPHSSDVERLISANNRLKTKLRSSLSVETENKYMYINTNMPDLDHWNPTAAAKMFIDDKQRRNRLMTPTNAVTRRQL